MESSRLRSEPRADEGPSRSEDLQVDLVILPPESEDLPEPRAELGPRNRGVRPTCPYCRAAVEKGEAKVACGDCLAWLHAECLGEHGACAACGSVAVLRTGQPAPGPDPAIRVRRRTAVARRSCDRCGASFEMVHHLPDRTTCGSCATKQQLGPFTWLMMAFGLVVLLLALAS